MDKVGVIITAEEQFAREVALGLIVTRPLKRWLYAIPGMFIVDFLRRGSEIRRFTLHYMFPRKLALDAVIDLSRGEEEVSVNARIERNIHQRFNRLRNFSENLHKTQANVVHLLMEHYTKLLKAASDNYPQIVRSAYENRTDFQAFIDRLTAAEEDVNHLVLENIGENEKVRERLSIEKAQVAKWREKLIRDLY